MIHKFFLGLIKNIFVGVGRALAKENLSCRV
jgi:hypothetical protein